MMTTLNFMFCPSYLILNSIVALYCNVLYCMCSALYCTLTEAESEISDIESGQLTEQAIVTITSDQAIVNLFYYNVLIIYFQYN